MHMRTRRLYYFVVLQKRGGTAFIRLTMNTNLVVVVAVHQNVLLSLRTHGCKIKSSKCALPL